MTAKVVADYEGKVVLVTGAGNGIGRASALAFAAAGASVAVVDKDAELGSATVESIGKVGRGRGRFFACDVSDEDQVEGLVKAVTDAFGRLDFAHNNAGISPATGNTVQCPKSLWDAMVGVNLTGVWLCMKYEIPAILAGGGGSIVNTASGSGITATANAPAYVATKHGVVGLTKGAALEFRDSGPTDQCRLPGDDAHGDGAGWDRRGQVHHGRHGRPLSDAPDRRSRRDRPGRPLALQRRGVIRQWSDHSRRWRHRGRPDDLRGLSIVDLAPQPSALTDAGADGPGRGGPPFVPATKLRSTPAGRHSPLSPTSTKVALRTSGSGWS